MFVRLQSLVLRIVQRMCSVKAVAWDLVMNRGLLTWLTQAAARLLDDFLMWLKAERLKGVCSSLRKTQLRATERPLPYGITQCYLPHRWMRLTLTWPRDNIGGRIIEVTRRWAGLVLRWVTIHGYTVFVFDQFTQANSAWPSIHG